MPTQTLDQVLTGQQLAPGINDNGEAMRAAALFGRRRSTCVGLTWGYYGGPTPAGYLPHGTVTLVASATNYIEADPATYVPTVNAVGFTTGFIRIRTVITDGVGPTAESSELALQYIGGSAYALPTAAAGTLGGVKIGAGLSIDAGTGVLSATGGDTAGTGIPDGGTAGQVLAKLSATDGDAAWTDSPEGGTSGIGFNAISLLSTGLIKTLALPDPYFVAFPAAGSAQILGTRPSGESGTIQSIQMSLDGGQASFDARLRCYWDQETTPSLDVDVGTLFCSHAGAHTGVGQHAKTRFVSMTTVGTNTQQDGGGANTQVSYELKLDMPYGDGFKVELYVPPGVTVPGGTSLFSLVKYQTATTSPMRLRSAAQTRLEGAALVSYAAASDVPFFDITQSAGWLVWLSLHCFGASNYSYLERPTFFYRDGESTPSQFYTGGEEWGATGWYFGAEARMNDDQLMLTDCHNPAYTSSFGVDLLAYHGGVKFANRLRAKWTNKTGFAATTVHQMAWAFLFYIDTSVVFAPAPGGTVHDNFNRDDATTLGTALTGQAWNLVATGGTPVAGIAGNTAYLNGAGIVAAAIAYVDAGTSLQDITLTLATIGTTPSYSGIVSHFVDINNYVILQAEAATEPPTAYGLYSKVAGSYTNIGSSTGVTPADGDVLRLVQGSGTTFDFYVNGTHFGPFTAETSVAIKNSTKAGFQSGSSGGPPAVASTARIDNFVVV